MRLELMMELVPETEPDPVLELVVVVADWLLLKPSLSLRTMCSIELFCHAHHVGMNPLSFIH